MKIAIMGSTSIKRINLNDYIPKELAQCVEIVAGGSGAINNCAKEFAIKNDLKLIEFISDYAKHGDSAPCKRNLEIISNSDLVVIFWDGISTGSQSIVEHCEKILKPYKVINL